MPKYVNSQLSVSAPIELYGAGQYELNNVKEVVTTESFLGMDQETIGCSSEEITGSCHTRNYLERLTATCHCIPFTLKYHLHQAQVQEVFIMFTTEKLVISEKVIKRA